MREIGTTPGHEFVTRRVNNDPALQMKELNWVRIHRTCPRCHGELDTLYYDMLPTNLQNQVISAGVKHVLACPPCNVFYLAAKR